MYFPREEGWGVSLAEMDYRISANPCTDYRISANPCTMVPALLPARPLNRSVRGARTECGKSPPRDDDGAIQRP